MLLAYLSLLCFIAVIYPYVLYPASLLLFKKQAYRPNYGASPSNVRVALLFCAYNEESTLPAKIENIRAIKKHWPNIEVRAYTDCCTDASVAILQQAKDVVLLHEGISRTGKAAGMGLLVEATDAEILIFTDANVTVEPASIARLVAYFADPDIGTVAGTLHYTNADDSPSAQTNSAYWRLEETIKRLESETGSTIGADGSLFATRRSLYPIVPANLLDDMIASISPLFRGFRIVSAPDVHAFERATVDSADEFRRKRRIACRAYNTHRYLWPRIQTMSPTNKFKYFSHKYLRWFSAAFLVMWVVFTVGAIVALAGMKVATIALGVGVGMLFVGRQFDVPIVSGLAEITLSILSTGLGVAEAIAGRSYQTWAPARS